MDQIREFLQRGRIFLHLHQGVAECDHDIAVGEILLHQRRPYSGMVGIAMEVVLGGETAQK